MAYEFVEKDKVASQVGVPYNIWGDGTFIYVCGSQGISSYTVDSETGELTLKDTIAPTDAGPPEEYVPFQDVYGDGTYIYGAGSAFGVYVFEVDANGEFTEVNDDSDLGHDAAWEAYGFWDDGTYLYVAYGYGGLHVYSVGAGGAITEEDSDDQGGFAYNVWGDASYIYLANGSRGVELYTESGGTLTHKDNDDQGGTPTDIEADANYVYVAGGGDGIVVYSIASDLWVKEDELSVTLINNRVALAQGYKFFTGYLAGALAYSESGGDLTLEASGGPGATSRGLWADANWIYVSDGNDIYVYGLEEVEALQRRDDMFQGFLKADTAVKVVIGPAVAVGDFFTPVTNLTLSGADEAELIKHDASSTTDISGRTFSAISNADGYYNLSLLATDVSDEGMLTIGINDDSLIAPLRSTFMVVNANVYDSLYAVANTDYLQVASDKSHYVVIYPDGHIVAYITEDGAAKTGLSATLTLYNVETSNKALNAVNMVEMGGGFYKYDYTNISNDKIYAAVVDGSSTIKRSSERYIVGYSEAIGTISNIKKKVDELYFSLRDWTRKLDFTGKRLPKEDDRNIL